MFYFQILCAEEYPNLNKLNHVPTMLLLATGGNGVRVSMVAIYSTKI